VSRLLVAFALLVPTAWYVVAHPPANLAVGRGALAACPAQFGPWNGTELSFENAVVENLKADDLLVRRYERGNDLVWLCIVYHERRRYGAHDPRLCYESQGYVLEPERRLKLAGVAGPVFEVNRFVAEKPRDRRVVYYCWTTRGLMTADAGAFRNRMALSGALEDRAWGAFVRVEAQVRDSMETADRLAVDFSQRVATALPSVFVSNHPGPRASR